MIPTKTEAVGYCLLGLVLIVSIWVSYSDPVYFEEVLMREDGIIEYATFFMLLAISMLCFRRLIQLWKVKKPVWRLGTLFFALVFLFGAGEEISWGQRILNLESPEFFMKHNLQDEINLHNLKIGDTKINMLVFSQILSLLMFVYLVAIPVLYRKATFISKLADRFAVPIVHWHHTIAFAVATVAVLSMKGGKIWEVYELSFSVIFLMIFIYPLNAPIFRRDTNR